MSNVSTFKFNDLPVRIVEKDGKPLFVIRDVCNILGFSLATLTTWYDDEPENGQEEK